MAMGSISSAKVDLLIFGPNKPVIHHGFSDQFVLHAVESRHDLERLAPVAPKIRGISRRRVAAAGTVTDRGHERRATPARSCG